MANADRQRPCCCAPVDDLFDDFDHTKLSHCYRLSKTGVFEPGGTFQIVYRRPTDADAPANSLFTFPSYQRWISSSSSYITEYHRLLRQFRFAENISLRHYIEGEFIEPAYASDTDALEAELQLYGQLFMLSAVRGNATGDATTAKLRFERFSPFSQTISTDQVPLINGRLKIGMQVNFHLGGYSPQWSVRIFANDAEVTGWVTGSGWTPGTLYNFSASYPYTYHFNDSVQFGRWSLIKRGGQLDSLTLQINSL